MSAERTVFERTVSERTGPVHSFAADLRALKLESGDPTLASLSQRTGISKSVLSEALSGKRLPTEKTISRLVEALGGDREAWMTRRDEIVREGTDTTPIDRAVQEERGRRPRSVVAVATLTAISAAIVTSGAWAGALGLLSRGGGG